ncbi:glycosyltransferase [Heyndrickxia acidicola]|uniref:Glycosyltransferase n=1 Tax=Heyndrickxia acidicola TaxID=209389 RepID=A0ABU6MGC6_9BACI|nr:glycosyltransferase [Heyndrickxia acidicola]MED1203463.1 glycosyltransferase [Heyndrickxia acidicola]
MIPKVSIIIPFYNCPYVDQAIQSALNQTYPNIEVVVIDDGSSMFIEKIDFFRNRIIYLRKENGGTATALNEGIKTAKGDYIAWLSSDDYFLPDKIEKQVKLMIEKNTAASFTNYDYIDEKNRVLVHRNGPRISKPKVLYTEMLKYNAINGCTTMIKKTIFDEIESFNPKWRFTHDYDMWFRLLLTGVSIHYLDEALVKFRYHKNAGTKKYAREIQLEAAALENHYRPLLEEYIREHF